MARPKRRSGCCAPHPVWEAGAALCEARDGRRPPSVRSEQLPPRLSSRALLCLESRWMPHQPARSLAPSAGEGAFSCGSVRVPLEPPTRGNLRRTKPATATKITGSLAPLVVPPCAQRHPSCAARYQSCFPVWHCLPHRQHTHASSQWVRCIGIMHPGALRLLRRRLGENVTHRVKVSLDGCKGVHESRILLMCHGPCSA